MSDVQEKMESVEKVQLERFEMFGTINAFFLLSNMFKPIGG